MKEILSYMENNPWMTFFILLGVVYGTIGVFKCFTVMLRGWPKADEKDPIDQ